MKEKIKNFFYNPWIIAIGSPIILSLASFLFASIKNDMSFFECIMIVFNYIKEKTIKILDYKVSIGSILVCVTVFVIILFVIDKIFSRKTSKREHPDWYYNFRSMEYKDWFFTWKYNKALYKDGYEIEDLKPICKCKCNLLTKSRIDNIYYGTPKLQCPNCKSTYNKPIEDDLDEVRCLIVHKVNNFFNKESAED